VLSKSVADVLVSYGCTMRRMFETPQRVNFYNALYTRNTSLLLNMMPDDIHLNIYSIISSLISYGDVDLLKNYMHKYKVENHRLLLHIPEAVTSGRADILNYLVEITNYRCFEAADSPFSVWPNVKSIEIARILLPVSDPIEAAVVATTLTNLLDMLPFWLIFTPPLFRAFLTTKSNSSGIGIFI
jgi:hypothetical protein